MTLVTMGAHVRSSDNHDVGKVDRLIMNPATGDVKAIVVRKGFILHHDVEIPLGAVQEDAGGQLRLSWTADQVRALPEFDVRRYTRPPAHDTSPFQSDIEVQLWPLEAAPPAIFDRPTVSENERLRLDLENAVIAEGSDVRTRDQEKVGHVHAVTLDPTTGHPDKLVVRRGGRDVELPSSLVAAVDDGVVYLNADREQLRAYEGKAS